jgi:hypothetical protein
MQGGKVIAYEARSLNPAERNYTHWSGNLSLGT